MFCLTEFLVKKEPPSPQVSLVQRLFPGVGTTRFPDLDAGYHQPCEPYLHPPEEERCLNRQLKLLPLHNLGIVNPEEITIQHRLDQTGNNRDIISLIALTLSRPPPDPVGDIERPVQSQRKEVVRGNRLGLAGALEHEQLREDGDRLEPDAEGPEDLRQGVLVGPDQGEGCGGAKEVLDFEGVDVGVVGGFVGVCHEVEDVALAGDEEDLEEDVVEAVGLEEVWGRVSRQCMGVVPGVEDIPRYRVT